MSESAFHPPLQPLSLPLTLKDAQVRAKAVETLNSFLVQAPAGSGKTELLTERFLRLLAVVDEPEQVLAITFTRAATAEMRSRVIGKLQAAHDAAPITLNPSANESAAAALRRSHEHGWQLLDQPQRLNIQTIDSLCLDIAHKTPLLARLGGTLGPTEDARPLYDLAAQQTFQHLGGPDAQLNAALRAVLMLRDNNLSDCEHLLAEMLSRRDQWGDLFLLTGEVDWNAVRLRFEEPFHREIKRVLEHADHLLSADPALATELMDLACYACNNLGTRTLDGLVDLPSAHEDFAAHWGCLTKLLLVADAKGWRKSWTQTDGILPRSAHKARLTSLTKHLKEIPGLLEILREITTLPPPRYDDAQWDLLQHLFTTLRRAVVELKLIFAEQNTLDFVEVALAAQMVLLGADTYEGGASELPIDHALAVSDRVRHLLVDEFQDTSRRQHRLLTSLLRGWDNCDGRTCFLVGDPMQSIYLFRQAEVELFDQVSRTGLDCDGAAIEMETLRLETNFRSHDGLVGPLNSMFATVFGEEEPGRVNFNPSVASRPGSSESTVHLHGETLPSFDLDQRREARHRETHAVVAVVRSHWDEVLRARANNDKFTIGILVRAKDHAAGIAAALRDANLPFRAVDLEELQERQEILDLVALTRALSHPMDRVAWLSILRAPWCGLNLSDLHALCGTDTEDRGLPSVMELLNTRMETMSPDGRRRAAATLAVMQEALHPSNRNSATMSYASWVERTWYGLGGHRCVDATGFENAQAFFAMLDELHSTGALLAGAALEAQLGRLFAQPDPEASDRAGVQIMTIHKAKGLEFDVVIVPGLERGTGRDRQSLICWMERAPEPVETPDGRREALIAPIGEKGSKQTALYRWVQTQKDLRQEEERKRVLYVACTRAAQELHLFGTVSAGSAGVKVSDRTSLLYTAWPALGPHFQRAQQGSFETLLRTRTEDGNAHLLPFIKPNSEAVSEPEDGGIDLAASAIDDSTESGPRGLRMRRLPSNLGPEDLPKNVTVTATLTRAQLDGNDSDASNPEPFSRPDGSLAARALGTTVHALFERAARSMEQGTRPAELRRQLSNWRRQAIALLRNNGVVEAGPRSGSARPGSRPSSDSIDSLADRAIAAVNAALDDPQGLWMLGPHKGAQSETSWTGWIDGALRTLRVDRIFRAGTEPLIPGEDCLWIVDYKTAGRSASEAEAFLKEERERYRDQLQMYGRMLRLARGSNLDLRLALYYPFLKRLEWWPM